MKSTQSDGDAYVPRQVETYAFDTQLIGKHMVFLAGPRQVGKTRLAKRWLCQNRCDPLYFNWDDIATRQAYANNSRFFESPARILGADMPWIVFDEIHKRPKWRNILKGAYDQFGDTFRFLVTGSARLDMFRRAGDSLVGRYNLFHMLPLSIAEVTGKLIASPFLKVSDPDRLAQGFEQAVSEPLEASSVDAFERLYQFGPFPEPFLSQRIRFCRKWHQDYISLLVREDLRDLSRIMALDTIEHLLMLMPARIMSPLSMPGLARELEVAHTTVKSWLEQLKRLYLLFPVSPWTPKVSRGLRKEKKWYFMDWYYAPEGAARLENMVAAYLRRACFAMTDMGYGQFDLHYIRTLDKKEIDFVLVRDHQPLVAIEVKSSDIQPSAALLNRRQWSLPRSTLGIQVVNKRNVLQKHTDHTWVISVERLLRCLP